MYPPSIQNPTRNVFAYQQEEPNKHELDEEQLNARLIQVLAEESKHEKKQRRGVHFSDQIE